MSPIHFFAAVAGLSMAWAAAVRAENLVVTPDRSSGIYAVGETAGWTFTWEGETPPPSSRYEIKKGGRTILEEGHLKFSNDVARVMFAFAAPGAVRIETTWQGGDDRHEAIGGAVASPDDIGLSSLEPADFDAFWDAKLAALAEIPAHAGVDWRDDDSAEWRYGVITMDHVNDSKIHGQLALPKTGGPFPAMLIVQWAGVYGLEPAWVTDRAAEGWLVLNILPHDLPIDQPQSFYREQGAGPLKDYWSIGNDSRETSYYLRMYLSCYRAADYLVHHPEWDGKTLVVMGGSQGGQQSLVTAGLHPGITAALAVVPAGCDMLGPDVGRRGGWPQWYDNTDGKDAVAVHEASRYFDVANFAPRITCPVLIGIGLLDQTCPPEGIFAAVNQIGSPKEVILLPNGEHQERDGSHRAYHERAYGTWLPALREGQSMPGAVDPVRGTAR